MSVNQYDNFMGRVNYAAQVISRNGNTTRTFDGCFENDDGDAVVAALARRCEKNAKLAANIARYLRPESLAEYKEKYRGQNLTEVARQLRVEGRAAFEQWMAEIQKKNAA